MIYVATRAGNQRKISEDAVLVGTDILSAESAVLPMPENGFVCIADGVGGNRGGAQASKFVLQALADRTVNDSAELKTLLEDTNQALIQTGAADKNLTGMATTLTGFLFSEKPPLLLHVGNTRAYIMQGSYLKQVTADHTTYAWLKSIGQQEAAEACNKNEIIGCFGGNDSQLLSRLKITELPQFSLALLTSDGVHEYVDLDTMEEILSANEDNEYKCEALLQKAIEAGSEDDMSAAMICLP